MNKPMLLARAPSGNDRRVTLPVLAGAALLALVALPALAQPGPPPPPAPAEDCGCGVPASPRGPR
jgi:hypothetical protein